MCGRCRLSRVIAIEQPAQVLLRIRQQVPVGGVDLGHARARDPRQVEELHAPGERPRSDPLDAFSPNRNLSSGLSSRCLPCAMSAMRQWRAANPEYMAANNERRRERYRAEHPHPTRPCVVCREPFSKRPDALVCGERCRNRRKRDLNKARAA